MKYFVLGILKNPNKFTNFEVAILENNKKNWGCFECNDYKIISINGLFREFKNCINDFTFEENYDYLFNLVGGGDLSDHWVYFIVEESKIINSFKETIEELKVLMDII